MAELRLELNSAERDCLIEVLGSELKKMSVEEHRTRAPSYREHILERENLMTDVLNKLKATISEEQQTSSQTCHV